jgi:capsular polysaccharide biosynthesis protein
MTPVDTLITELLNAVSVRREELLSQENFLEQLKVSREILLSQEQLLTLVTTYRESLAHQEQLLQELSPFALPLTAWRPLENDAVVSGVQPTLKLRTIEQTTGAPDILVRIKRTWVGRLYANHLKQVPLFRWLTIWLWRTLYPVYTNTFSVYLGSRASKRWRPLVKLGDYVKVLHLPTTKVFDAARVDTPAPKVFPVEDQAYFVSLSPHDHYVFPPVYVAELGEALVYGGTNLVFAQDTVICHDLYDFERDYTSEELHGRHVIDAKKLRMRLLRHDATPEKIAVAAAFVDACAPNYAHWLTEVLPRIAAFCTVEQFAHVPIIVNDGLHRNIMESLALVVGPDREIITLPVGRAVQVGRLYAASVAGYVPFEKRDVEPVDHSHGLFCPPAFQLLRDHFSSFTNALSPQEWPSKVYLRRTSGARKVANAVEVEQIFLKNGYVVIEPETLTFLQQVSLFHNVEHIAGPTGSAFANPIFSPRNTQVLILVSKHRKLPYWYWISLYSSNGVTVNYALGKDEKYHIGDVHSDFYINPSSLNEYFATRA